MYDLWKENIKSIDFLHKFIWDELDIYIAILEKKRKYNGTLIQISLELEVDSLMLYGFLLNIEKLLDIDIKNISDTDHIELNFDFEKIYDYLAKSNAYSHLLNLEGWKYKKSKHEVINIGILAAKTITTIPKKENYRFLSPEQRTLMFIFENAADYGINLFSFTLLDVDINTKTINGTFFEKNGLSSQKRVDYPQAIDSLIVRDTILNNAAWQDLVASGILFTRPPKYTDKQKRNDIIPNDGPWAHILIPTTRINSTRDLLEILESQGGSICVKPLLGAFGLGIYVIQKDGDKYLIKNNQDKQELDKDDFITWAKFFDDNQGFLAQPYKKSRTPNGNVFDVRLWAKRGEDGKFLTYMYSRLASIDNVTIQASSNTFSTTTEPIADFVQREFSSHATEILASLDHLANNFCEYYQGLVDYRIFNMGIDLGLSVTDTGFEICLFEVNLALVGCSMMLAPNQKAALSYYRYLHNKALEAKALDDKSDNINVGILAAKPITILPNQDNIDVLTPSEQTLLNVYDNAKEAGINLFSFTIADVDLFEKKIKATFIETDGTIVRKMVPYPHVIDLVATYNNTLDKIPAYKGLIDAKIPFTRPPIKEDKYKRYLRVPKDGIYSHLLIPTRPLLTYVDVVLAFKEYGNKICVKPLLGAFGKGVFVLEKKDNLYQVTYNMIEKLIEEKELVFFINDVIKGSKHLIQPYKKSVTDDGRVFDIRLWAKRGADAKFLKYSYVRATTDGRITVRANDLDNQNHIKEDTKTFITREFKKQSAKILKELDNIHNNFPKYYQKFLDYELFNVGLDIGISVNDNNFSMFLYEININLVGSYYLSPNAEATLGYYKYLYKNRGVSFSKSTS